METYYISKLNYSILSLRLNFIKAVSDNDQLFHIYKDNNKFYNTYVFEDVGDLIYVIIIPYVEHERDMIMDFYSKISNEDDLDINTPIAYALIHRTMGISFSLTENDIVKQIRDLSVIPKKKQEYSWEKHLK